jgi:hypothetical protein
MWDREGSFHCFLPRTSTRLWSCKMGDNPGPMYVNPYPSYLLLLNIHVHSLGPLLIGVFFNAILYGVGLFFRFWRVLDLLVFIASDNAGASQTATAPYVDNVVPDRLNFEGRHILSHNCKTVSLDRVFHTDRYGILLNVSSDAVWIRRLVILTGFTPFYCMIWTNWI